MQIVFESDEVIQQLQQLYTLLELETFTVGDVERTAFCVVDTSKLQAEELFHFDAKIALHKQFVKNFNDKNFDGCLITLPYLKGAFGSQLDSFYDTIEQKIQENSVSNE